MSQQLYGWKKMTWIGWMEDVLLLTFVSGDDMANWLAKTMSDVYSLHVEIEKYLMHLVGFCFIRGIDVPS